MHVSDGGTRRLALLEHAAALDGELIPPEAAPAKQYAPSEAELDELADEIKTAHAELQASVRTTVDKAVTLGRVLLKAKERIGHGWWLNWLDRRTKIKRGMAAKYMLLARGQQEYVARDFQRIKNLGVAAGAAELTRWYREERKAEREEVGQEQEEAVNPVPAHGHLPVSSQRPLAEPGDTGVQPHDAALLEILKFCACYQHEHPRADDKELAFALSRAAELVRDGILGRARIDAMPLAEPAP